MARRQQQRPEKWLGGYVRWGVRGPTYVIDRWVNGVHFHLSTGCRTEANALKEFSRWEADPSGYSRKERVDVTTVAITVPLMEEFADWQLEREHLSPVYVSNCASYLKAWALAFEGRDLRRLDMHRDVKPLLEKRWTTARRFRAIALKAFCSWLRHEKGLLLKANDPASDLQVPAARPAQQHRQRAVGRDVVRACLAKLEHGPTKDAITVLSESGLHLTELRRFVDEAIGELREPTPDQRAQGAVAVIVVRHKSGDLHPVALTQQSTVEALQRLRAERHLPCHETLTKYVNEACDAAKVARFKPGGLRHSFATWLVEDGVPLDKVAELLGHRSSVTTRRFYAQFGSQARVVAAPMLRVVR